MKTRTKVIGATIGVIVLLALVVMIFGSGKMYGPPAPQGPPISMPSGKPLGKERPPKEPQPQLQKRPVSDGLGNIDRILESLEFGSIAFNAPRSMNLHDTALIQLLLKLATPPDELKRLIEPKGDKEGARIRVSDRMEARLSGPNLAITAITPEIQAVSRSDVTEWKWEVKPSSAGRHSLHLTISALLSIDGTSTPRAIRTFDKVIDVDVTWPQRVGSFFTKNWQWLWAAILVPIVGWLWKKKRGMKKKKRGTKP